MALACAQESNFCFCTFGNNPTWHSDLYLPLVQGDPVHNYMLTVYESNLVIIGGTCKSDPINRVWSLSSMKNDWKGLPSMLTHRSSVTAVGYGDHLASGCWWKMWPIIW